MIMVCDVQNLRVGHRTQQVAHETVELRIGDEMSRLLLAKRSAQNSGEAEQGIVSASQAIRCATGTDQFALDAKCSGLKRDEINVFEGSAINRLAKH